jgi:hypothetical protein
MKINKWTVGLAAAGLVSLPAITQAEEKPNQVLTALASTTLSGYVDTSAHWAVGSGNAHPPPYAFNTPSKQDGFNLNVVKLTLEKPLDEGSWAAGYRVDLIMGPNAQDFNPSANSDGTFNFDSDSELNILQAYVALRAPVGNGIDFKIGSWNTIIGYETFDSPSNPNYTRSYGWTIEPTQHTGLLASYQICKYASVSAGVANTQTPGINVRANPPKAESYKAYMASVTLTAPEDWGWAAGSTLSGGVVNGFSSSYDDNVTSWYAGATLNTPVKGLKVGAAFDWLEIHNWPSGIGNDGDVWSVGGYVSYQVSEKLSVHGRAEWVEDKAYYFTDLPKAKIFALTGTVQYDLWANVLSRLEVRWDHAASGGELFGGKSEEDSPSKKNEVLIAANIVYKF